MKRLQFRVRTLLLLTAAMGVVFVVCAKWPVTEGVPAAVFRGAAQQFTFTGSATIMRPPNVAEWAIRASIALGMLLAVFVLIGVWRARKSRSPAC